MGLLNDLLDPKAYQIHKKFPDFCRVKFRQCRGWVACAIACRCWPGGHTCRTYNALAYAPKHGAKDKLLGFIANIRVALSYVRAVAEQMRQVDRWKIFLEYVVAKITRPLRGLAFAQVNS